MSAASKFAEFITFQNEVYDQVRTELATGRKRSHWMWFIFPQMLGLGHSAMAVRFGITSQSEALAYFQHPVLGRRLRECVQLLLTCPSDDITSILGAPDDLKLRSCLTLFAVAVPQESLFHKALEKFYGGQYDKLTLELLRELS